jgi:glycosyltransferase involved in cell wall biosynthesis
MTLENILAQRVRPLEIVVVDDGSDDGTEEMVTTEFGGVVKFVKNDGKGPGAARNTGIKNSSGEFIQFFDSDDLMTVNKLEVQLSMLEADPGLDLVYGPYVMAEETGKEWKQLDVIMQYSPLPDRPVHTLVGEGWCAITQSCLFRRAAVERAGPWREDLMPHEDKEYWYRLGKVLRRRSHENKSCVFYRQHQQQITDQQVKKVHRAIDGIKAFDLILEEMTADRVSTYSRILCKGIRAGYVKYLQSQNHMEYKNSIYDLICYTVYLILQKIGRIKTSTNWQPIHGPLSSETKFEEYKKLLPDEKYGFGS